MLSTSRSRVRALAVVGMAAVTATIGAVTYNANAATTPAAAPGGFAAPAAFGPGSRQVSIPGIPDVIKPPAGSKPIGAYIVTSGTQNYTCGSDGKPGVYGKSTPEAELVGTGGKIHHFGGPTWQSRTDNSSVKAAAQPDNVQVPGSIPQLLLKVTEHPVPGGILGKADWINRLYTSGGAAPASCTDGQKVSVPYKAVYVFWDDPAI